MKFGTQKKSNILIINISIGIGGFDPNYKFAKFSPKCAPVFMKFGNRANGTC